MSHCPNYAIFEQFSEKCPIKYDNKGANKRPTGGRNSPCQTRKKQQKTNAYFEQKRINERRKSSKPRHRDGLIKESTYDDTYTDLFNSYYMVQNTQNKKSMMNISQPAEATEAAKNKMVEVVEVDKVSELLQMKALDCIGTIVNRQNDVDRAQSAFDFASIEKNFAIQEFMRLYMPDGSRTVFPDVHAEQKYKSHYHMCGTQSFIFLDGSQVTSLYICNIDPYEEPTNVTDISDFVDTFLPYGAKRICFGEYDENINFNNMNVYGEMNFLLGTAAGHNYTIDVYFKVPVH